jgi:hypothetical protein
MADYYLLPPRPVIGEEVARLLRPFLPGLPITAADGVRLLDRLTAESRIQAFIVHREDLPEGADAVQSLQDGYGAGPSDRVVQIAVGPRTMESRARVVALSDAA